MSLYWGNNKISGSAVDIATSSEPGIVQPDGTTITVTSQGIISAQSGDNTAYVPFSINNGTVDTDGNNLTLTYSNSTLICSPCTITTADSRTKTFSTDNLLDCSSVSDGTYKVMKSYTDGSLSLANNIQVCKKFEYDYTYNYTEVGTIININGILSGFTTSNYAVIPTFSPGNNSWEFGFKFTTGSDISTYQVVFASMKGVSGEWSGIFLFVESGKIKLGGSTNGSSENILINGNSINTNTTYWAKAEFTGNAYNLYLSTDGVQYTLQGSTTNSNSIINSLATRIGVYGNGVIHPFLGSIDLKESYIKINNGFTWKGATKITPDLWLDTSSYQLTLKQYDGNDWQANNDLVSIGDVNVASGIITAIKNNYFNACPARRDLVGNYINSTSWYSVYSDGWCEQGGSFTPNAATTNITLLKPYANTNYFAIGNIQYASNSSYGQTYSKTTDGFVMHTIAGYGDFDWIAKGYTVL